MKYLRLTILWIIIIGICILLNFAPMIYIYLAGLLPTFIFYKLFYNISAGNMALMVAIWPILLGFTLSLFHQGFADGEDCVMVIKGLKKALSPS